MASQFFSSVYGAGTTVSIALSYCPAPPVSPTSGAAILLPSDVSSAPFFLYVSTQVTRKRDSAVTSAIITVGGTRQYVAADAILTTDLSQALALSVTAGGQLMSGRAYFSTSGLVGSEPFEPHSNTTAISTLFSDLDGILVWTSDSFSEQQAQFCAFGALLEVVFDGVLPVGCVQVELGIVLTSAVSVLTLSTSRFTSTSTIPTDTEQVTISTTSTTPSPSAPGSIRTDSGIGDPVGCLYSPATTSALSGTNQTATSLEKCLDFCITEQYFGLQHGNICVCSDILDIGANPASFGSCNVPCSGNSMENCGGSTAMAVYTIVNRDGDVSASSSAIASSTTPTGSASSSATSSEISSDTSNTMATSKISVLSSITSTPTLIPTLIATSISTSSETSSKTKAHISSLSSSLAAPISATTTTPVSLYPSPTSTGVPNCYDRSLFDGTVNGGYLILCNTDLSGFDIETTEASSLDDCIAQCNDYLSQGYSQNCVAVEYDMYNADSECSLKYDVSIVNRGGNSNVQAAVVVNEPYAPTISFSESSRSPTSTTSLTSTSNSWSLGVSQSPPQSSVVPTPASSSQLALGMIGSTPGLPGLPQSSSSSLTTSRLQTMPPTLPTTTTAENLPGTSATTTSPVVAQSSNTSTIATTPPVLPFTTPVVSPVALSSTTAQVATSPFAGPTCSVTPVAGAMLCPAYNHQMVNIALSCYEIECSTTLQGTVIPGANSTNSLNSCIVLCNLYNLALPYGCVGANYYSALSFNNCVFMSGVTGTAFTLGVDSGRLEYAGYLSPTDALLTASSALQLALSSAQSTTDVRQSTTPLIRSTTSVTQSTTHVGQSTTTIRSFTTAVAQSTTPTVQSTTTAPPNTSPAHVASTTTASVYSGTSCQSIDTYSVATLCPGTPHGTCYSYNTYGMSENYETECATQFIGAALQPCLAFNLQDCIGFCQYNNMVVAAKCVGVSFLEGNRTLPPFNNCFPYSKITGLTRDNSSWDSGRLLYSVYPSVTDYSAGYTGFRMV